MNDGSIFDKTIPDKPICPVNEIIQDKLNILTLRLLLPVSGGSVKICMIKYTEAHIYMSSPLVTVVISTYRRPELLKLAIESVLNQTFTDYEIIVVDDNSGEEYTRQYGLPACARLISHNTNHGCAGTKNTGTQNANGKYVAYLDDDDLWEPEKLQKQVKAFEDDSRPGIVFVHYRYIDMDGKSVYPSPKLKNIKGNLFHRLLHTNFIKSPSAIMIKKDLVAKNGWFDETLPGAEDWGMWTRVAYANSIVRIDDPLLLYRTHQGQMTGRLLRCRTADVEVMQKLLEWAKLNASDEINNVTKAYVCRLLRYGRACGRTEQYADGIQAMKNVIEVQPWNVRAWTGIAGIHLKQALK